MALADPIFSLDGAFQLFWTAFDMHVTMVSLEVVLGLENWIFGHLKNNHEELLDGHLCDYFFLNVQKSNFSNPNATSNSTTVTCISKAAQNN